MPDTSPSNRRQPQASTGIAEDANRVEQALNPGIKEIPGYLSSEAVEIKARIKPVIKLFLSYAHKDDSVKTRFVDELEARVGSSKYYDFVLSLDNDLLCGDTWHDELQNRLQRCDYGILLVSSHFLSSTYIQEHEIPVLRNKSFPVALKPIDLNNQELHGLEHLQIFFLDEKPFSGVSGSNQQRFINKLVEEIEQRIQKQREGSIQAVEVDLDIECVNLDDDDGARKITEGHLRFKGSLYECERFIDGRANPGIISHQTTSESSADTVLARPYIQSWALESEVPFFALLGDFGTGKTFTCRMLAREISARHHDSPESVPLCIYIDLRRVQTRVGSEKKVPRLVDVLRDAIEFSKDPLDKSIVTPEDVILRVRSNEAMIIFDGLDEKTVHFTPEETNQFIAELWSIREQRSDKENAPPQGKILISCRTHYFRDAIEQNTLFLGRDREGRAREEYRSCTLLPFDSAQIRAYLEKRLGCDGEKIDRIVELFEQVHNLKDLASRPYTLNLVTESIPDIERKIADGGHVNTATLYDTTVENWLARDEGKHEIDVDHKRLLMQALAAEIHRNGGEGMKSRALNRWLDQWLLCNPEINGAYANIKRETLKKDLRTATFIIREEEDYFSFAHTSLQEYFLAGFLVDAFSARQFEPLDLAMNMPSKETLDFVADMLATDERKGEKVVTALASILETDYRKQVSELAFALWLKLHERGMRTPAPRSVRLEQAELAGWVIGNLNLSGARFDGADLRGTSFRSTVLASASFNRATLVNAEFFGCNATGADYSRADAVAGIWRNCDLSKSRWSSAELRLVSFVECQAADMVDFPEGTEYVAARCKGIASSSIPPKSQCSIYDGHSSRVTAAAFSPDGKRIISGSYDNTLKLWDVDSGNCLMTLSGHRLQVTAASFSPDGKRIISASFDKTIKIWDVDSGNCIKTLSGHTLQVTAASFNPDGKHIISASFDKTIKIWDADSGNCIKTLSGHTRSVRAASFRPDGKRIISASSDKTLKLWDADSGNCLKTLSGHFAKVFSASFSFDGQRIISASFDKTVKIWDAETGQCIMTLSGHGERIFSASFNSNGQRIISASYDSTIKLWDAVSGNCQMTLSGHTHWANAAAFSPDGTRIISASYDSTIKLWDALSGNCLMTLYEHRHVVTAAVFSPDGKRIISAFTDNTIKIWDALYGNCLLILSGHSKWIYTVAFSPDGQRIISASSDNTIKIWDAETGQCLMSLTGHSYGVNAASFSPDGQRIISAASDNTIKIWDSKTGQCLMSLSGHSAIVHGVAFSPDGQHIISAANDKTIIIWDSKTGQSLMSLSSNSDIVTAAAFSPNGQRIISTIYESSAIKLWDANSGVCILTLSGHFGNVWTAAFSPDGLRIISGSADSTIKIWDAQTGQCLMTMANLPDNETASWSETEPKLLSASPNAWRWIGLADGCRRLPIELLADPAAG